MTAEPEVQPRPLDRAALDVLILPMHDPRVRPLLDELAVEYDTRYGDLFGSGAAAEELNRYPAAEFEGPTGALLIIQEDGKSIAGGAFRRYDATTAELKRIWTHTAHRRRGLARLVLAELEALAAAPRLHRPVPDHRPAAARGQTPLSAHRLPGTVRPGRGPRDHRSAGVHQGTSRRRHQDGAGLTFPTPRQMHRPPLS